MGSAQIICKLDLAHGPKLAWSSQRRVSASYVERDRGHPGSNLALCREKRDMAPNPGRGLELAPA